MNDTVITTLERLKKQNALHHAYCIVSPSVEDIDAALKRITHIIVCDKAPSCGACRNCVAFDNGVHPDIHWISANAGENIKIDAVHALRSAIAHKPQVSKWSIGVITKAHQLTVAAANALLKSIEEPPTHTIVLLGTTSERALLPTIQSRVHILRLGIERNVLTDPQWTALLRASAASRETLASELFPKKMEHLDFKKTLAYGIVAIQSELQKDLLQADTTQTREQIAEKLVQLDTLGQQLASNVNKKMILDSLITLL